jgi:cation transport ATPase
MVADFKRRFWVALPLTVPVLLLSPMIQDWLGVSEAWNFPYDRWVQWIIATAIFLYGCRPFLKGLLDELRDRQPGMMTLIALAITVAYGYSSVVVFGVEGPVFFWELATLIDIMLLGHWLEMRSVMGASNALQELVALLPADAHRVQDDGITVNSNRIRTLADQGKTVIHVLVDDKPAGAIALADIIRDESREALRYLKEEMGVQVMMLTGDSKAIGAVVMSLSTVIVAINARLLRLPRTETV